MSMSEGDEFRRYAEEAMRGALRSQTEKEKQALIGLARTWMHAAQNENAVFADYSPPERGVAR
jgi:hypothetical protein